MSLACPFFRRLISSEFSLVGSLAIHGDNIFKFCQDTIMVCFETRVELSSTEKNLEFISGVDLLCFEHLQQLSLWPC
jgi:hypothetical protein